MTKPIYICNRSKRVTDLQVEQMTALCSFQLQHHIAPAWGRVPVPVFYTSTPDAAPAGSWVIVVMDTADDASDLGYHSEDDQGRIYGRVFAGPVLDNGGDALSKDLSVASVLSHEIAECFIDANCDAWWQAADGTLYAAEIGDPVEDMSYHVSNGNVSATLSNFILPAWADNNAPEGTMFDYLHQLKAPFTISASGYCIKQTGGAVSQVFGDEYAEWRRASKTSELARTARRLKEATK